MGIYYKLTKTLTCSIFISLLSGCVTDQQVIEIGDNSQSCDKLRSEISKMDKKRKEDATVTAAGMGGTVAAAMLLMPLVGIIGGGVALVKGNEAYQSRERMQHLTDVYNNKGCANSKASPKKDFAGTEEKKKINQEIVNIQNALNERGYDVGTADGIFGNKSKAALMLFQEESGFKPTGRIDKATKEALLSSG